MASSAAGASSVAAAAAASAAAAAASAFFLANSSALALLMAASASRRALAAACFSAAICSFVLTILASLAAFHAFPRKDVANRVGGLRPGLEPIQRPFEVQVDGGGVGVRVVRTQAFDAAAITWRTAVSDHDVVVSIVLTTVTLQSHFYWHVLFLLNDYT